MSSILMKELLEDELHLAISFKNLTSETSFDGDIKMIHFTSQSCSLLLPKKTCALGHQVLLRFYLNIDPKFRTQENKIEVVGKITEQNSVDEKLNEITVTFNQYSKQDWQSILDKFERKQEVTSEVIRKLKLI